MGMGVDIRSIKQIIHIEPPRTIREYVKETERAGRDGTQSEPSCTMTTKKTN